MEKYTKEKVSTFKERFRELCDSNTTTDTALADKLGVSKQTISSWKSGHRSPKKPMIQAIAKHFGVTVEWLMGFDAPKTKSVKKFYVNSPNVRKMSLPRIVMNGSSKVKASDFVTGTVRKTTRGFDQSETFGMKPQINMPEHSETVGRAEKMMRILGRLAKDDPESAADLLQVLVDKDIL